MSQILTRQMGRLVAAGTLDQMDATIETLARLRALHFVDYDGSDDDLALGAPSDAADALSRDVNKLRAAASLVDSNSNSSTSAAPIREALSADLHSQVDSLLSDNDRLAEISAALESLSDEELSLQMVAPLNADVDLLGGFESLTAYVGTVRDLSAAKQAASNGLILSGNNGKKTIVGVFVRNEDAKETQSALEEAGFAAISIPECDGSVASRLNKIASERKSLMQESETLNANVESWSESNADVLHSGLELLERDQELATAPVRVAVTDHAFIIDGWIEMARADEVSSALSEHCTVVDIEPFKIQPGGGAHGHNDHGHHQEMPPIAFQERSASKPMELLTDAVGRPAYGRIDPTVFMFITYPIFFGMMLGDMAYGMVTMLFGVMLLRKAGTNDMLNLGGKFLLYIGLGTFVFGYIYAEFAGWEIFPHYDSNPAVALQMFYPEIAEGTYHAWHASLPFGLELAFPFHRVSMVEAGGNLEHLILLTIYLGVAHVFIGLVLGFRDIWLHGNGHGDEGFVCALFEKGSWMILLFGGFLAAYAFLSKPAYEERWVNPDPAYLDLLSTMMTVGGVMIVVAVIMIMWMLWRYHGVPFPINIGLGPIEAVGMMPTVISYVRLFAVGVVGVKIAETGNTMLFDKISMDEPIMAAILVVGWLAVQFFAWGLGVFSPNIHAARLHFVEWMRQFYDASGEAFKPFGFKARRVEVE
ncbi:MAG: V-type ATPase 116kDa subunit family protein [Candidatus Thalassarchaeaceae archaeon]|nr:V-type ATPase 116kDa subunit family protein [Candidatus Thalassarchaeaceae archaeon]